jgi:signal transduction histidine kinase
LIYAPLPFLLWASVRLGPGWVSISLLITTLLEVWNTIHGRGLFSSGPPVENVLSLQIFLIAIAVPLMFLAGIIQERRRLMGTARQNEERLDLALNAAQMGTWDWQIPTNRIVWSDASKRILGLDPASSDTTFEAFLNSIHPDDLQTVSGEIQRAVNRGTPYETEFRAVHPDETVHWIMGKGRVFFDEAGRPARMVGVNMNITKHKQEELEAEQQRREMVHLARLAIVGELSGALAHELNQPLTAILSNAQAAQRFLSSGQADPAEIRDILNDIVKADQHAGEVIRRLRAMLKKEDPQFQELDLNEVTTEALGLAHSELAAHGVMVTRLTSRLPKLYGDRVQLQQVLLNIIINACEAMSATDPALRRLEIATRSEEGDAVQVSVSDNGSGISEDKIERMFDPFFTTKDKGLGLGLSICRSIITAHGGRLWAANIPGCGAAFYFTLPVKKTESQHEDRPSHSVRS